MKKYTATISIIDNDYHAWVGDQPIQVDSWEDAIKWCDAEDWTGHSHVIENLMDNTTKEFYRSRKEVK